MPQTVFDELFTEIAPYIPAASRPSMRRAARLSATEFCKGSEAYRHQFAEDSVADAAEYVLTLPEDTRLHKVISIYYDAAPLSPTSERLLRDNDPKWRGASGPPDRFFQRTGNKCVLVPAPPTAITGGITGEAALQPTRTAAGLDSDLLEEYYETIVAGALHHLFAMPQQPWSDVNMAAYFAGQFSAGMALAKSRANQDGQAKLETVKYGGY